MIDQICKTNYSNLKNLDKSNFKCYFQLFQKKFLTSEVVYLSKNYQTNLFKIENVLDNQ